MTKHIRRKGLRVGHAQVKTQIVLVTITFSDPGKDEDHALLMSFSYMSHATKLSNEIIWFLCSVGTLWETQGKHSLFFRFNLSWMDRKKTQQHGDVNCKGCVKKINTTGGLCHCLPTTVSCARLCFMYNPKLSMNVILLINFRCIPE